MTIPIEAYNKLQLFYKSKIVKITLRGEGAMEFILENGTIITLGIPSIDSIKVHHKDDIYPTLS